MSATIEGPVAAAHAPEPREERSARRERIQLLLGSPVFIVGALIVVFWIVCAIFGSSFAPQDPYAVAPMHALQSPSGAHWFGTDDLGRDVLSRVIVGAQGILIVAPLATILGTVVGTTLGLITGYFHGLVDNILSRFIDAFLSLPTVIIALLAIVALSTSKAAVILVIAIVFAPIIARTVRAAVLQEREMEYVSAAQLRNENTGYILFAEILPNVMGPVLVEFTVRLGYAIFTVATLSFLGFGIQPPAPDWGLQIFEDYGLLAGGYWWPVLFPALAVASLVIGVNMMADAIAKAFER
ncbi:MAG TPA: ABC transporter permease [Streptosporangiaceae bacterium]|jgi:peptide/nickel transport system permease protein